MKAFYVPAINSLIYEAIVFASVNMFHGVNIIVKIQTGSIAEIWLKYLGNKKKYRKITI